MFKKIAKFVLPSIIGIGLAYGAHHQYLKINQTNEFNQLVREMTQAIEKVQKETKEK
jgi:hypothetical protein